MVEWERERGRRRILYFISGVQVPAVREVHMVGIVDANGVGVEPDRGSVISL